MENITIVQGDDDFRVWLYVKSIKDQYLGKWSEYTSESVQDAILDNDYGKLNDKVVIWYGVDTIQTIDCIGQYYVSNHIQCESCKKLRFNKFKPYDKKAICEWIEQYGQSINFDLSEISHGLFINCGNDTAKIYSEIQKLRQISKYPRVATKEDYQSVGCYSNKIDPSLVINSMSNGNVALCITFYDKLQERCDETGWIATYLHAFLQRCLRTHEFIEHNVKKSTAANSLGVSEKYYSYILLNRYKLWDKETLTEAIEAINKLNKLHRQGTLGSEAILESLLIKLSLEARKCLINSNSNYKQSMTVE